MIKVDVSQVDIVNILDSNWDRYNYYCNVLYDQLPPDEIRITLIEYNLFLYSAYQLNYLVWRFPDGHHLILKRNILNKFKSRKYMVLPFE